MEPEEFQEPTPQPLSYARREQIAATDTAFVGMIAGACLRHAMYRAKNIPGDDARHKAFTYAILSDVDSRIRAIARMVLADMPDLKDHTTVDDAVAIAKIESLWETFVAAWPDGSV